MTDQIGKVLEASSSWDQRPMPDLGAVVARGRKVRRRRQTAAGAGAVAAALLVGAVGYGAAGAGTDHGQVAPAVSSTTTSLPPLKYDWPQGYAPGDKPVYAGPATHLSVPKGAKVYTVGPEDLPPATTGPLKGVRAEQVTMVVSSQQTPGAFAPTFNANYVAGGQGGRVLTVDDKLSKGQMVAVRALYLAYGRELYPVGTAPDLLGWTVPWADNIWARLPCPEWDAPDPNNPGSSMRVRMDCEVKYSRHPNLLLDSTEAMAERWATIMEKEYGPCVRRGGGRLVASTWVEYTAIQKARPADKRDTYPLTDVPYSSREAPYLSCYTWDYTELIPVLKGFQNPTD